MSGETESPTYRVITISRPKPVSSTQSPDESSSILNLPAINSGDVTPGGLSDAEPALSPSTTRVAISHAQNDQAHDDILDQLRNSVYMDPSISISELLSRSDYLQKYPSWLGYCGPENKKKYAPTFIARNDTIWELIFSERGYVDMLLMVHDVYMTPFPRFTAGQYDMLPERMSSTTLSETLFPGLKELLAAHERILRPLLALHDQAENHVVESLGPCLVKLFDTETQASLSHLYGGFLFAQNRIREELPICKRCPLIASFLESCKQNPRSSRKSLEDCHMVIVQRWTKVETLLEAIIRNTLNRPSEVAALENARNAVRSLLKQAEAIMTQMEHAVKLAHFADLLHVPLGTSEDRIEARLLNEMRSTQTTLINYGPLRVTPKVVGQHTSTSEVTGIALNSCFFMLQRIPDTGRYQLFKGTRMPPVLWWGEVYGYFRKSVEKGGFGFYILLQSNAVLTLFHCSTVDELARWESILNNGFAQCRELAPPTMEALDLDLKKARNAIAEKWQRTEAVTELLRDLDRDLKQACDARMSVCAALIHERIKVQMPSRRTTVETVDSERITTTGSQSNTSRARSKNSVSSLHTGSTLLSSTTSTTTSARNSAKQNGIELQTTTDLLRANTYIDSLTSNEDLDQLFSLFQENLARLSFALVGSSSAGLSRSASDVEERRRPFSKPVRKNETFSVRDSISHANDPKMLAELGRKVKKRDAYRLSSTVASIFRGGSRDKSSGPTIQQQTSLDLSFSSASGASQSKGFRNRPPSSNVCATPSPATSRLSASVASTPIPPRPSLGLASGQTLGIESFFGGGDSAEVSGNGSCASLLSQPSTEALVLLRDLNHIAEEIHPLICDMRTETVELRAQLQHLQADRDALNETHRRTMQHGLHNPNCNRASCGDTEGSESALPTLTVKQETEKLRQDYETFTRKSEEWEKERQRQRDQIEREHTKLAKERTRLDEEWAELERRQRLYEENCKTLQDQINLYTSRGIKFTGITMPELRIPDVLVGPGSMNEPDPSRGSCTSLGDLDPTLRTPNRPSPIHFHSTSDDLSSKWAQTSQLRGHPSLSAFENDATPRPSLAPTNSLRHEDLPEHLRGSLLNQRLQTNRQPSTPRSLPDNSNSDSRLINSWCATNPNTSTSSLMKLADSSKVRPAQKTKKSSLFRLH